MTLTPAELAGIGVWLSLPWTVKMVFGQLVDSVPIFGSQRRSYILIGAAFTACRDAHAGWRGRRMDRVQPSRHLYILGAMLIVVGTVIQDVVADAMSTEVVSRVDPAGNARPEDEVRAELGMVQVLGRLALGIGILAVAGLSGWLAQFFARETVFLFGLVIPAISAFGVLLIRSETSERRPIDWRILGGGIGFGLIVLAVALGGLPFATGVGLRPVDAGHLHDVVLRYPRTRREDPARHPVREHHHLRISRHAIRRRRLFLVDARRPQVRRGLLWQPSSNRGHHRHRRDVDLQQATDGVFRDEGAVLACRRRSNPVLAQYRLVLRPPPLDGGKFGFGARAIAVIDAAAASPFAQLSMIPLLTLIAFYAPEGHRATWFALMASLMNLALVAGQLQTKYLNHIFVIQRGEYSELGPLLITAAVLGFILPIGAILLFGRRA